MLETGARRLLETETLDEDALRELESEVAGRPVPAEPMVEPH